MERRQSTKASRTTRKRHDCIKNPTVNGIVIATELLTRTTPALHNGSTGWQEDKIQGVWSWLRECGVAGNFLLQQLLNGLISHRGGRLTRCERDTPRSLSMCDRLCRNIVFAQ